VPHTEELVACGAAAQAAMVLTGRSFDDIADAWQLGDGITVDPHPSVDGAAIRDAYRAAAR
jgi:sugar (pentulose or hexulose) kinase